MDLSVVPEAWRVADVEIQSPYTPPRVCVCPDGCGRGEDRASPCGYLETRARQHAEAFAVPEIGEQVVEKVANVFSQP